MKRTIAILLFFMSNMLYAETGYRGHQWYQFEDVFSHYTAKESDIIHDLYTLSFSREILGEKNTIYYAFTNKNMQLISAGYIATKDKLKLFKTKIQDKKNEKTISIKLQNKYLNEEDPVFRFIFYTSISTTILQDGINQFEKDNKTTQGNCTVSIYNYNDDTRIYLFETEKEFIVVYAPYEQDY